MADDDYKLVRVRVDDWRALHRMQMEREAELDRKPSLADVIHDAVTCLEREKTR